jgi:hypothetical protein
MNHAQFRIGLEFWCGGRRWRCTDVGRRTVIAICLEPHEVVSITRGDEAGGATERIAMTDDDSWFVGPPYAVAEEVFDEYDVQGCSLSPHKDDE